jgi:hypothetical protein
MGGAYKFLMQCLKERYLLEHLLFNEKTVKMNVKEIGCKVLYWIWLCAFFEHGN